MTNFFKAGLFAVLSLFVLAFQAEAGETATDMAGVWQAHKVIGPEVRGNLSIWRDGATWQAEISGYRSDVSIEGNRLWFELPGDKGSFRGTITEDAIQGQWIQPPALKEFGTVFATPVTLLEAGEGRYRGRIEPLDDEMDFFLVLEKTDEGTVRAFLRSPELNIGRIFRFDKVETGEGTIRFIGGLAWNDDEEILFEGPIQNETGAFSLYFPDFGGTYDFTPVAENPLSRFYPRPQGTEYHYSPPQQTDDGWPVATLEDVGMARQPIEDLIQNIINTPDDAIDALRIHGILIARQGKLVLEEYFHGLNRDEPHDTRSAAKSITSTILGIAINDGAPLSLESKVYEVMNGGTLPEGLDPRAGRMTLKHLLTMTPGFDCYDGDENSKGNEDVMQSQDGQPDWTRYTLDLEMLHEPGEHAAYCSASPNLALAMLSEATGAWIPDYFFEYVAKPLNFGRYHINLTPVGEAYGGGGVHITGRDFLKFGQLLIDGGVWKGQSLLSEQWARDAILKQSHMWEEDYGYNWWLNTYPFQGGEVGYFYAGGNGGQYIIGVPDLDLVIVIFGGNYNQRVMHKPKYEYVPDYILRAIAEGGGS